MVGAVGVFARPRTKRPSVYCVSEMGDKLRFPGFLETKHGIKGAGVGLCPVGATDCQVFLPAFGFARHEAAAGVKATS